MEDSCDSLALGWRQKYFELEVFFTLEQNVNEMKKRIFSSQHEKHATEEKSMSATLDTLK